MAAGKVRPPPPFPPARACMREPDGRCRSARSSRPPRRRPRSPASCPSTARADRAPRRARAAPRTSGGCPRARSASGGIVIRPADGDRAALEERVELGRRDAALALLAGDVDLDEHARARGGAWRRSCSSTESRADRVDEAHERRDLLDLAALQVADEVPRERVAVRGDLRLEVLRAVLADDRRRRPRASAPSSSTGDVLHRRDELDVAASRPARAAAAAIRSRTSARFARTRSAVRPRPARPSARRRHAPHDAGLAAGPRRRRGGARRTACAARTSCRGRRRGPRRAPAGCELAARDVLEVGVVARRARRAAVARERARGPRSPTS